jgi:hypothetical protein
LLGKVRDNVIIFQVQSFYRSFDKKASRLCAVAIKSGDGVIVIDICGPKSDSEVKWPLLVKIYKDDKMSDGTNIYRAMDGRMFKVIY